ncbi:protein 3 [Halhan virus 2]|uniref:protein 3 n=1 Tax=Halhan virus 2 TaxID=2480177 RepID=UPI000F0C34FD|nr:protein 3 [Halhan virus 2]AYN75552.1 protein 3 [Halhan virus 2]
MYLWLLFAVAAGQQVMLDYQQYEGLIEAITSSHASSIKTDTVIPESEVKAFHFHFLKLGTFVSNVSIDLTLDVGYYIPITQFYGCNVSFFPHGAITTQNRSAQDFKALVQEMMDFHQMLVRFTNRVWILQNVGGKLGSGSLHVPLLMINGLGLRFINTNIPFFEKPLLLSEITDAYYIFYEHMFKTAQRAGSTGNFLNIYDMSLYSSIPITGVSTSSVGFGICKNDNKVGTQVPVCVNVAYTEQDYTITSLGRKVYMTIHGMDKFYHQFEITLNFTALFTTAQKEDSEIKLQPAPIIQRTPMSFNYQYWHAAPGIYPVAIFFHDEFSFIPPPGYASSYRLFQTDQGADSCAKYYVDPVEGALFLSQQPAPNCEFTVDSLFCLQGNNFVVTGAAAPAALGNFERDLVVPRINYTVVNWYDFTLLGMPYYTPLGSSAYTSSYTIYQANPTSRLGSTAFDDALDVISALPLPDGLRSIQDTIDDFREFYDGVKDFWNTLQKIDEILDVVKTFGAIFA